MKYCNRAFYKYVSKSGVSDRLGLMMGNERLDDLVEKSARHYRIEAVKGQIYTVIAYAILREIVGADTPRAISRANLAFALASLFSDAFRLLHLVKARL